LGLGFSFGAKDAGLGSFLSGVDAQFQQVTETLRGLYSVADTAPQVGGQAAMAGASGAPGALAGAAEAAAGLGDVGDAAKAVEGVSEAADAASAAGDAMSTLGSAGHTGGKLLSGGAFKAVGALGRVAGAAGIVGMAIGPVISGFGEAVNAVQGFGEQVGGFLPGMVQRGMDGISRMNQGINLTNSLEAEAQGLSVSARSLGANLGYTGDRLNDFTHRATSMAMALNMGSDSTGKAIRAWDEAGTELRSLGFGGAADVARFTEAFGVDADTLRNSTMQMTREFGLTTDQVRQVMSSTVAYGQASGDVSGAIGGLEASMSHMREEASLMGETLNSDELMRHAASAQALAAGLFQVGQTSGQTLEASQSLAQTMVDSRREFHNMFAGTQDELPGFANEIAIATGDVQQAFDAMQQGPSEFVEGMIGLVEQTRQSRGDVGRLLGFMNSRLEQTLGPEQAAQLTNFFRQANPEILDMMHNVAGASRNLGDMGREAHRTGRTLQESFDRALEGANTALRSVTRRDTASFVRDTGREMRRLGGAFRDVGNQQGPLGEVVKLMSRTAQMGQLGLVPERFRTTAVMANQIHENMQPLIASLTSFGGMLDFAATQGILFGTRVVQNMEAARAQMSDTADESAVLRTAFDITANEFADSWIDSIDTFERYFTTFVEGFEGINWANLFTPSDADTAEGADGAMGAFQHVVQRLRQVDWSGIWQSLANGAQHLWDYLQPYMQTVWNDFQRWIVPELEGVWKDITDAWNDWWDANWMAVATGLAVFMTAIFVTAILAALAALAIVIVASFVLTFLAPFLLVGALLVGAWELVGDSLTEAWHSFTNSWSEALDYMPTLWSDFTSWLGGLWDDTWNGTSETFESAMTGSGEFFKNIWTGITSWFSDLWSGVVDTWQGMWDGIFEFFDGIAQGFRDVWQGVADWFTGVWGSISGPIDTMLEGARAVFSTLSGAGEDAMHSIGDAAEEVFGNSVNDVVGEDMDATQGVITAASEASAQAVRDILYNQTLQAITSAFADAYTQVSENTGDFTAGLEEAFTNLGDTISTILGQIFLNIVNGSIVTMQVAEDAASGIIQNLQAMAQAQRALADARFMAADALTPQASPQAQEARVRAIEQGPEVIRAIHYPEWYERSGTGYQDLFRNKMDQLIGAVHSGSGGQTTAATRPDAARQRREFAARAAAALERGLPASAATPAGIRR